MFFDDGVMPSEIGHRD